MRTGMIHKAEFSIGITEDDQVFTQQPDALRRTVDFQVPGQEERNPVQAHQLAHRGSGADPNQGFVILRSEEHTSELQSLMRISYDVFCLKKNKIKCNK